jgi:hypothetical protein
VTDRLPELVVDEGKRLGPRARRVPGNGGFVYFVTSDAEDLVKIGRTSDRAGVRDRLRSLQAMSPIPLKCLAAIGCVDKPDLAGTEGLLHRISDEERAHGEWFTFSPYLRTTVGRVSEAYGLLEGRDLLPAVVSRIRERQADAADAKAHWDELVRGWIVKYYELLDPEQRPSRSELKDGRRTTAPLRIHEPPFPPVGDFCITGFDFVNSVVGPRPKEAA